MKQYKLCCIAEDLSTMDSLGASEAASQSFDQFEMQLDGKRSIAKRVVDGATASTPTTTNRSELLQETKACDANRAAGVEVVTLATVPILCSDTSLSATKTFGDESIASLGQNFEEAKTEPAIGSTDLTSKDADCTSGAYVSEVGNGVRSVEVAFASESKPIMHKLLRYIPMTPHQSTKQRDVKLIIEEGTGNEDDEKRTRNSNAVAESVEGRDDNATPRPVTTENLRDESPNDNFRDEYPSSSPEDATDEKQAEVPALSTSSEATPSSSSNFLRRVRSMPGKAMVRNAQSLAEIHCSPTFDPKGALKEQFETKMESPVGSNSRVSKLLRRNAKSVAFGIGANGFGAVTGPVRSILRKKAPASASLSLKSSQSTHLDTAGSTTTSGATAVATLSSSRSWQPRSWSKPRATSLARPYTDIRGSQGNIELIKHSLGTSHPAYLQSVTFDPEGDVSNDATRRKRWTLLRSNKSGTIVEEDKEDDEDEEESETENAQFLLRSPSSAVVKTQEGTLFAACSPRSCLPLEDIKNNGIPGSERAMNSTNGRPSQAGSMKNEVTSGAGEGLKDDSTPKKMSCPISTTTTSPGVKVLPNVLPRSSSHSSYGMRRTSSQKSRPTLQYPPLERNRSLKSVKQGIDLAAPMLERNRSHKAVKMDTNLAPRIGNATGDGGMIERRCKTTPDADVDPIDGRDDDQDFELKLAQVAKVRQKPHQSLRDAMEELEVELLEARSFKNRSARQIKFKQIRDKTRQILKEHQRKGKPE